MTLPGKGLSAKSFIISAVMLGFLALAVFAAPGVASARVLVPPSYCLSGDADPRDVVSSVSGPSFFSSVTLYCGDPTKGVLHIDAAHPISVDGSDDDNVVLCLNRIMYYGEEVPAAPGNRAWQIARSDRWSATTVFDADTLEVISMFTSDSNNWAACAAFTG